MPWPSFTIRFGIWDTYDSIADSTVLIDNLHWEAIGGGNSTVPPSEDDVPTTVPVVIF